MPIAPNESNFIPRKEQKYHNKSNVEVQNRDNPAGIFVEQFDVIE